MILYRFYEAKGGTKSKMVIFLGRNKGRARGRTDSARLQTGWCCGARQRSVMGTACWRGKRNGWGRGAPKWGAGVELRWTGHRSTGTLAWRGLTSLERCGARRWLCVREAQGGVGMWTRLMAVAPHGW
jgi:hypothetical protein